MEITRADAAAATWRFRGDESRGDETGARLRYPADRIEGWLGARVRELGSDGEYWSDINPEAQALARRHVLHSDAATKAWTALAASRPAFPVHLWVAGPQVDGWGTVATWDGPDGIHDLVTRLPGTTAVEFPKAGHSIHNSDADAFVARLLEIINEVEDGIVRSKK